MKKSPIGGGFRKFGPPTRSGLRDVDAAGRALRLRAVVGGGLPGFLMGAVVAAYLGATRGLPLPLLLLLPFAAGAAVYLTVLWIVGRAGDVAGTLYNPSGASTPRAPEFSRAEALAVRGDLEDALHLFREAAAERPDDPRPLLRVARLLRDELGRYEEAALTFRTVRRTRSLDPGVEILVTREIAEIHLHRTGEPLRAAPELARLVERFPGTREAAWAEETLREVRAALEGATRPGGDTQGEGGRAAD